MKKQLMVAALAVATTGFFSALPAVANEPSTMDKVEANAKEMKDDTVKGAKKMGRKVKDKTCEWVNGKMECAAKRAGNAVKNGVDEVKDKAND